MAGLEKLVKSYHQNVAIQDLELLDHAKDNGKEELDENYVSSIDILQRQRLKSLYSPLREGENTKSIEDKEDDNFY